MRPALRRRGDELLDKDVVFLAAHPLVTPADVERIGQPLIVVGADIEKHRQRRQGMDAAAGGVERELADRDAHAAGALIAEAEDALAVGDDDHLGAIELRIGKDLLDALPVLQAQEQPARLAEQPAEVLAARADRRRVGDRQQLLDVAGEQRVEHGFVGVLQLAQERVALEIGGEAAQHLEPARHLLVQRRDARRQQAVQLEDVAFLFGERRAFVQEGIAEQLIAGKRRHHLRRLSIDLRRTRHDFKSNDASTCYRFCDIAQSHPGNESDSGQSKRFVIWMPWTRCHRSCWNFA